MEVDGSRGDEDEGEQVVVVVLMARVAQPADALDVRAWVDALREKERLDEAVREHLGLVLKVKTEEEEGGAPCSGE